MSREVCVYQQYVPTDRDVWFDHSEYRQCVLRWTPERGSDTFARTAPAGYTYGLLCCEVDGDAVPAEVAAAEMGLSRHELLAIILGTTRKEL